MTNTVFDSLVNLLSSNNLLESNQQLLEKIKDYSEFDIHRIVEALLYLKKINLLNQTSVHRCLELAQTKPVPRYSWMEAEGFYDPEKFNFLSQLNIHNIKIDQHELNILLSLKPVDLERISKVTMDLYQADLLDDDSFKLALKRVTEKFSNIKASSMSKKSRTETGANRSELTLDNEVKLYPNPDKKDQMQGGVGRVKKAYRQSDADQPQYIIKKIGRNFLRPPERDIKEAKREVKYNKLLGREAYFYQKNKPRVVAEWVSGKEVDQLTKKEILDTPYIKRITCIASAFQDLDVFHSHYRVFGDLSTRNFIINLNDSTMRLIDFGSSHKMGTDHIFETVSVFDDPHDLSNRFYRDFYGTGIVIMCLFPELYEVSFNNKKLTTKMIKTSNLSPVEQAIMDLVQELMKPETTKRCTSEDALRFCKQLIENFDRLTPELIQQIESSTIRRTNTTVEDVLRGVIRGAPDKKAVKEDSLETNDHLKYFSESSSNIPSNNVTTHRDQKNQIQDIIQDSDKRGFITSEEELVLDNLAKSSSLEVHDAFKQLNESQKITLIKILGKQRLSKLTEHSFRLERLFHILSPSEQLVLISSLDKEHLKKIVTTYSSLMGLLDAAEPEVRPVLLEALSDKVTQLLKLPSFLKNALSENNNQKSDAGVALLQFLGDNPFLRIEKAQQKCQDFEPWVGIYDKTAFEKYLEELQNILKNGRNCVLQLSVQDSEKSKKISIEFSSLDGWVAVGKDLPSLVISSASSAFIADQLFSILAGSNDKITVTTQFSVPINNVNNYSNFSDIARDMSERQAINQLEFLNSTEKLSFLEQAFQANNRSLCEKLIDNGIDFYASRVDSSLNDNNDLFNLLCETQAKFNIEKLKRKIFDINWKMLVGGETIKDLRTGQSKKVPKSVAFEWKEIEDALNGKKSYYDAWVTIVDIRKESAKSNEQKFFRRGPAKDHYMQAENETPILKLKSTIKPNSN